MKARPIIFSAPMVRALLDGRKTQTRRIVRAGTQDDWNACPYGVPGDLLWVRETCRAEELGDDPATYPQHIIDRYVEESNQAALLDGVRYLADDAFIEIENSEEAAERWLDLRAYRHPNGCGPDDPIHDVRSIHMPRWASRLTLRITDVRVERVQDISGKDALAEGIRWCAQSDGWASDDEGRHFHAVSAIKAFRHLWTDINGPDAWDDNPWVWVLTFEVLRQNVDAAMREGEG